MHLELTREIEKELQVQEKPDSILSAQIWHCKYRSLLPIKDWRNIETLVIATFPDQSLEFLGQLTSLRYLSILHLPKVTSLAPLENLSSLVSLSLETSPGWDASGKVLTVDSLEPISKLQNLQHIQLFGVRSESKSLKALENCHNLKSGRFSKFPKNEVLRFQEKMSITNDRVPEPIYAKS